MTTPLRGDPLLFEPILKPKVWGGRRLQSLGKTLPTDEPYGESWELVDLPTTSADGGGGSAEHSRILNGPLAGQTLDRAIRDHREALLGSLELSADGGFPLLLKYLDANAELSVQVHPSPEVAARVAGAHLKTESWYIVDAEPGAVIYKGLKEAVSPDRVRSAIADGSLPELMLAIPVKAGDCHHLPSGTCHALGAGILVAEVQTPSDTTYRLFDWGRTGRTLHIDEGLESMAFGPPSQIAPTRAQAGVQLSPLETNAFYSFSELALEPCDGAFELPIPQGRPIVVMVLRGEASIETGGDRVSVTAGQTVMIPACAPRCSVAATGPITALVVTPGR